MPDESKLDCLRYFDPFDTPPSDATMVGYRNACSLWLGATMHFASLIDGSTATSHFVLPPQQGVTWDKYILQCTVLEQHEVPQGTPTTPSDEMLPFSSVRLAP